MREFVANNAEDLTADRINLLKTGYEKIMEAYNNKSAILPGNSAQSRETICNWHQSTILEYAKYFKDTYLKDKQDLDPASYQYELLAVIKRAKEVMKKLIILEISSLKERRQHSSSLDIVKV